MWVKLQNALHERPDPMLCMNSYRGACRPMMQTAVLQLRKRWWRHKQGELTTRCNWGRTVYCSSLQSCQWLCSWCHDAVFLFWSPRSFLFCHCSWWTVWKSECFVLFVMICGISADSNFDSFVCLVYNCTSKKAGARQHALTANYFTDDVRTRDHHALCTVLPQNEWLLVTSSCSFSIATVPFSKGTVASFLS